MKQQGPRLKELDLDDLVSREWLAANGIGGYASSTIPGLNTRKYHGLLVAALTPPVRRMVLLSRVEETLWRERRRFALDCNEYPGVIYPQGHQHLRQFHAAPFPCWIYEGDGWILEKRLGLLRGQNTVVVSYKLLDGGPVELEARPLLALRKIHELSLQWNGPLTTETRGKRHHRVPPTSRTPEVFFAHDGQFVEQPNWYLNQIYRREQQRGYSGLEDLWTPGVVRFELKAGREAHFVCSADPIDFKQALRLAAEQQVRTPALAPVDKTMEALRQAAAQFVVSSGTESNTERMTTCIGGYPWFAPGGREALIAFTGLLLVPGRFDEARSLLLSSSGRLRSGLLPSRLPEDGGPPVYHDADASLWFINALWNYLRYTADEATGRRLLDACLQILDRYRLGTDLGISVDSTRLLAGRAAGTPTSWMDGRIGDWVVTPRVGRPVELNALWYNAVRIVAALCERYDRRDKSESLGEFAVSIQQAFNHRFWNPVAGCCFDTIDEHGPDPSVRPNQLLAMSLQFPVLSLDRHEPVLRKVAAELLTPRGLRTLSPADPGYRGSAQGNITSRERAYHNGSAFPWLLGHYVTALLRVRGRGKAARREAHDLIRPCIEYVLGEGLGQLCELFDGDAPHQPGGAVASAPAIAEIFRCYCEDVLGHEPAAPVHKAPLIPEPQQPTPKPVSNPA